MSDYSELEKCKTTAELTAKLKELGVSIKEYAAWLIRKAKGEA